MRKAIGAKFDILCYEDAKKLHPEIAEVYLKYPTSKFYTDKDHKMIRRIYGMMQTDTGFRAHAITALIMMNNSPIDGVPIENLVPLDNWEQDHLARLNSGLITHPQLFTDPLGFLLLVYNNSE